MGTADQHKLHHILMNNIHIYIAAHTHTNPGKMVLLPFFFFKPEGIPHIDIAEAFYNDTCSD